MAYVKTSKTHPAWLYSTMRTNRLSTVCTLSLIWHLSWCVGCASALMLCCCCYIGDSEWFGTRPSDLSRHLNWLVGYMGCTDTQPVGQKIEVDSCWIFLVIDWIQNYGHMSLLDGTTLMIIVELSISDQSESWSVKHHQQHYITCLLYTSPSPRD